MFIYMILFIQASGGSSRQGNFYVKVPQNLCSELRSLINCNAQPKRLNSSLRASNRQPLCCCFANIDYSLREEQFSNAVSCYSDFSCVIASKFYFAWQSRINQMDRPWIGVQGDGNHPSFSGTPSQKTKKEGITFPLRYAFFDFLAQW